MAKKKIMLLAASALSLLAVAASATYAWFVATDTVKNTFVAAMLNSGIEVVESFKPPKDWKPGEKVDKKAAVKNDSDIDLLVRVSFEEALKILERPAKASSNPNSGSVPALANPSLYSTWKTPEELGLTVKPANLPNGVTVKAIANEYPGATDYTFAAYKAIEDGKSQLVTAKYAVSGGILTISDFRYWYYNYAPENKLAWAKLLLPQITASPIVKPPKANIGYAQSAGKGDILINYDTDGYSSAITSDKWYYNENDGFFYYIGAIKPGSTTPNLIDSIQLSPTTGSEYSKMDFKLCINAEAIQATKLALDTIDGWGIAKETALYSALAAFCVDEGTP